MSASNYDEALRRLLVHEGGYTNDPADPGGPTNFGITIHDYRKYVKPDATPADVRAMQVNEAKEIYRARYWDAQRCDELPAGADYAVFDYGVNSGIGRSGKVLRRLLGMADASGEVNDDVLAAARRTDARILIAAICDERLRFLQSLKTWPAFGRGWARRVAEVKEAALRMASASTAAPASKPKSAAPKAAAAVAVTVGAVSVQKAQAAGIAADTLILVILAAAVLAGASWLTWRGWKKRRRDTSAMPQEKIHELE